MNSNLIVLAGRYKIRPEKKERFLELALMGLEKTRQEPGNISYSLYEDITEQNSFIYFEEWKDRDALVQHLKQSYIVPLLQEFPDLVDGEVNVRVYDVQGYSEELPL